MTKKELRSAFKAKRKELSPGKLSSLSEEIIERTLASFQLEKKTVSIFLPIERQKEINTYSLWEKIRSFEGHVAIPKVNVPKGDLKHYLLTTHAQLAISEMGIPEPQNGKIIAAHKIEIVIVPLLCFDNSGHRVGYGGGYYDKFLKKCNPQCKFIGLSIFPPVDKIEDTNNEDVKLHAVVTPTEVYRF